MKYGIQNLINCRNFGTWFELLFGFTLIFHSTSCHSTLYALLNQPCDPKPIDNFGAGWWPKRTKVFLYFIFISNHQIFLGFATLSCITGNVECWPSHNIGRDALPATSTTTNNNLPREKLEHRMVQQVCVSLCDTSMHNKHLQPPDMTSFKIYSNIRWCWWW